MNPADSYQLQAGDQLVLVAREQRQIQLGPDPVEVRCGGGQHLHDRFARKQNDAEVCTCLLVYPLMHQRSAHTHCMHICFCTQAQLPPLAARQVSDSTVSNIVVLDFSNSSNSSTSSSGDGVSSTAAAGPNSAGGSFMQLLEELLEFGSSGTQITVVSRAGAPEEWQAPGSGHTVRWAAPSSATGAGAP